ncbi:hypothetical protein E1292_47445 [Nonomuraea deserti]|uniref:Uncharacterized protein n=1 Tax=Nonomuraea deserti TaxID=1848322 RepID=A0A4R4U6X9_9ACTN|nr:hypothetical protein [Nonomuraea deserti]TDC86750.1 hypothetical protein E1292_47445 [Nonomuraea deserti]
MSEVVPLPSFGEVFFDARGQERCLRVTWHEGTLVLSLWRGEMCTASFRMPMEDVGRLLDTLDDGYAEATGEQPAVAAQEPGTEVIPGTGQYHRPSQHAQQPPQQPQPDDRPTAALSPNDVLVARGAPPAPQDKLVASYGETAAPREQHAPAYGETAAPREQRTPAYGERAPFTGPQYVDQTAPQQAYTGDPFSGSQYTADPMSGPHYIQQGQAEPFTGPQYVENEPVYQMPGDQRRQAPASTDPLGFPSQAADPYQPAQQHRPDPYPSDPYQSDPYGRRSDTYRQPQPPQPQQAQPQSQPSTAGLGTPMHGIPGAGRPRPAPQQRQAPSLQNPVDPLLALGRQEHGDPEMTRPYVGDPMFSTGERLRPEQPDYHERSDRREW